MSMTPDSYEIDETVMIGLSGAARTVERSRVEDLLVDAETFALDFEITPETAGQSGEILRLGTSFIVRVDTAGELVVRAEVESGEKVSLATTDAGLDRAGPHAIGIGLEDGVLSATVDGKLAGQMTLASPITVNGWTGHDFSIGNPWDGGNYAGALNGFGLHSAPLDLPESTEAEEMARDPLVPREEGADFRFEGTVQIDAEGSAQSIARSRVEDLLVDAETFALDFEITPETAGQSGEILRLGTSFIVRVDTAGELVVRAEVESGEKVSLATEGARMGEVGAKDIRLGLAEGDMSVLVDGAEVGRIAMPSPIMVNGWAGHDFSIGNPWNGGNYAGALSGLRIEAADGTSSPAPGNGEGDGGPDPEDLPDGGATPETGSGAESDEGAGPPETGGEGIRVSDAEALQAAIADAEGGDTIVLAAGDYGTLSLRDLDLGGVTIAAGDPGSRANFSGLDLRGVSGVTFRDVAFDYAFDPADPVRDRPFSVHGGREITFDNTVFSGDRAVGLGGDHDGFGWAVGLSVRDSEAITVEDSEFVDFWKGAIFRESQDLVIRGNDLHGLRSDGLNFAEVRKVLLEENRLHDFDRAWESQDHADMIQFWTRGSEAPSGEITIRGNHLDIGAGDFTQSIFMRNEMVDRGLAGEEMFYQDVTIEDNVIVNGHRHGITVGETAGLVIRDNTVLHGAGSAAGEAVSALDVPRISVANGATDARLTGNVAAEFSGWEGQSDWVIADNLAVQDQDPDAPGYYGDVFLSSTLGLQDGQHALVARPGGEIDRLGVGASATRGEPEGLTAAFHVSTPAGETATRVYDARYTSGEDAELLADAAFTWTFSDGSRLEGPVVQRAYAGAVAESAHLRVDLPDGTTSEAAQALNISGSTLLSYEAGGDMVADDGTVFDLSRLLGADGLDLDRAGKSLDIGKAHIADIAGADEFVFDFDLQATGPESDGEIFRYGTSLAAFVTDDGEIEVKARTEDGRVRLRTSEADLADTASHDVEIFLLEEELGVSVDGTTLVSGTVGGGLVESGNHGLYFGNPWGGHNFEGVMRAFEVTRNASDFPEETLSHVLTPEESDALLGWL